MINIKSYAKAKKDSNSNGTGFAGNNVTVINSGSDSDVSIPGVYLWGNYHDHSNDINGDIVSNGSIYSKSINSSSGNILTLNSLMINSSSGKFNNLVVNDASVEGKLWAGEIESTYGKITTIDSSTINSSTGRFNNLYADYLEVINATIDYLTSKEITTEKLTVTKAAHFFKLIIDEIKSSQGQILVTPANTTIDKVETLQDGSFKCYFRATDDDKKIYLSFEVNDQVVCQTFNVAEGVSYDVSNKFYWRLCTQVSNSVVQTQIDGETVDCHYIVLSDVDKDTYSNGVPEVGDAIVLLGNRSDTSRLAAITIGAYNNPYLDNSINAPFIIQYDGINDYNLSTHRVNVISNGYNYFKGSFTTNSGDDIEDLINDIGEGVITYVHQAYANSSDGRLNFSKTYFTDALYTGFCSNHTASDSALIYSDYEWARIKGEDGTDGESYKLVPIQEAVPIDQNGTVGINIRYNIVHYSGTSVEIITADTNDCYVRFLPSKARSIVTTYTNLSTGTTTPYYTNFNYETNWKTNNDHLLYITVELVKVEGNDLVVYDKRVVYAQLSSAASFTITDEIVSTVQGVISDVSSNTNAISTIQQQFDNISLTVEGLTTDVSTNTTNISNLTIRMDGISSIVNNYSGVQLINDYGWTKADGTAAVYDEEFQGYDIVAAQYEGHTYYDVYSNVVRLEAGKTYTFSFYTEFSPNVSILYSATNKRPVEFNTPVSKVRTLYNQDTYLDNPRVGYTFTTTNTGYYCVDVYYQGLEEQDSFYRPQLELGEKPTEYDVNAQMISSQIVLTANEILLAVGNTGIDITNGKINLNSTNTIINGNLKINSADSGFELYDSSTKVILIDNDSIGAFDYQLFEIDYLELVVNSAAEKISGMAILGDNGTSVKQLQANTYVDFTELFVMSTEPNNATIKLRLYKNTTSTPAVTNYPYGNSLTQDWELVQTITKTQTTSNNYIDFLNSDGMYRLKIEETAYYCFTFSVQLSSFTDIQYYSLAGKYYINQTDYTHIASDGVQLSSTNNSNLIMNDEAFKMRFKDNEITVGYDQALGNDYIKLKNKDTEFTIYNNKITATVGQHILEFNENEILENTYPIIAENAREETSNTVVVSKNDEFIVINNHETTSLNVNNSDAKYSGHKFIVKHLNGNAVNVIGSVIDYDSGSIITNKAWNDKVPRQFIYLNGAWYIMKLG